MLKEYAGLKLTDEHGNCIKIMNEEDKFFTNVFNNLDMDSSFEVQKLAINFRKWAKWNKAKVTIEVLESYEFNTIVVVHNMFDEIHICDSWQFLKDIVEVLSEYADTDDRWEYMTYFWNNEVI